MKKLLSLSHFLPDWVIQAGLFLILYFVLSGVEGLAQNVGIGTTTPTEKLDVNGNLNVSGNIKINNAAGQNGQVLMTGSNGSTIWANIFEYKNFQTFHTGTTNWTVPAGVTKVLVELWGGGGGGAFGGGGGGGAYVMSVFGVTPATTMSVTVGGAGSGANTSGGNALNGGESYVIYGGLQVSAWGGSGAFSSSPGSLSSAGFSSGFPYVGYGGEPGSATTAVYGQYSSTIYFTAIHYGKGGSGALAPSTGGSGGFRSYNTSTLSNFRVIESTGGTVPGGGGGGGGNSSSFFGRPGAKGMVIIRW